MIIPPVVGKPFIFFRDSNQIATFRMIYMIFVLLISSRQNFVYPRNLVQVLLDLVNPELVVSRKCGQLDDRPLQRHHCTRNR